jgi:hypothetical protein
MNTEHTINLVRCTLLDIDTTTMPLPPTQTTVVSLARKQTLRNSLATPKDVDKTYEREWKKYNLWVTMNRQNNVLPAGDKYLTRENVDLYFSHIVANRHDIQPATAHRTMSSLQSYEGRCDWHEVKN